MLALEGVLLALEAVLLVRRLLAFAVSGNVSLDVLLLESNSFAVSLLEEADAELNVADEGVGTSAREILTDHNSKHLQSVRVGGHGIGGHDPATGSKVGSQGELVVVAVGSTALLPSLEAECNKRKTLARLLGHDDEAALLKSLGEVIGGSDKVAHDGAVTVLAEADKLVVLANDLRSTLGEVEGERRLLRTEVVDVEDELLREVFLGAPDNPANTRVDETVLLGRVRKAR